ncbi:uncharacterized protein LOC111083383, partial [Limulus polyphemus]|uniref:Uncharacterized protein LOC111083383 n=1 Tax=Limulus polyphemus TaxID=6850 RepID=A0ABM1RW32_LIMPO
PSSSSFASPSSHLPVKSISSVAVRNSPGGAGIGGTGNKHATYTNKLDKVKHFNSKEKAREKSGVMPSSDGSQLLPVTLVPSSASFAPSMSTQEVTNKTDVATKSLTKRTPGGRYSSGVKQTVTKPTPRGRRDAGVSRLSQSKAGDETRLNQSKASSSNLFHRDESASNGSPSRPKPKDGNCDRSQRGYRTEVCKQGQACKSSHPDNPVRQSKISTNLTPRNERTIKTESSGSVGVDNMWKNGIPKPTAA